MGNWQKLIKEYDHLINRFYVDQFGDFWQFFGLVHGEDDYYYGMKRIDKRGDTELLLLTCVGDIEDQGFKLAEE